MDSTGLRCLTSLAALVFLFGFARTQDPQSYYFSSANSNQNRFVPSPAFQNSRQTSYLSGTRGSSGAYSSQPGSYQEQLLFIGNDAKQPQSSAPQTSAAYSPFGSQFSQSQNSDYFDISPRPFGVPGTAIGPISSNSLTRSKAIRTNGALVQSTGGFIPQQHLRPNVPHQQTQFLAHFNESPLAADKPVSSNRLTGQSRPSSGFSPSVTRNRAPATSYNSEAPLTAQAQQQLPFRNTRNRFQPNSSTASTTSTTQSPETAKPTSSKRFNRFGGGRTPFGGGYRAQNQTPLPAIAASNPNKTSNLQSRRPVFISREPNEPVNVSKQLKPLTGRIKLPSRDQFLKQKTTEASVAIDDNNQEDSELKDGEVKLEDSDTNKDTKLDDASYDEALAGANQLDVAPTSDESLEKLALHKAQAPMASSSPAATNVDVATKSTTAEGEDHTMILTSNFFLPKQEVTDEKIANNGDEAADENVVEAKKRDKAEDAEEGTTERSPEYEYEYVDDEYDSTEALTEALLQPDTPTPSILNTTAEAIRNITTSINDMADDAITTESLVENVEDQESVVESNDEQEQKLAATNEPLATTTETIPKINPKEATTEEDLPEDFSGEYDDEEYEDEEDEGDENENNAEAHAQPTVVETENKAETGNSSQHDREVVSVVTTKSVVNGSTAYPAPVTPSGTTLASAEEEIMAQKPPPAEEDSTEAAEPDTASERTVPNEQPVHNTTESYVVVASIQTSRSINGARFLPFPAIEQEETKQTLSELERKVHGQKVKPNKKDNATDQSSESNEVADLTTLEPPVATHKSSTTAASTESIIDKLDRVQSELSSGLLSGKYPIISEMEVSTQSTSTTSGNRFAPNIRKFQPKSTAAPKVKIHHLEETEMDELAGLLPVGFKPRSSYKQRKLGASTTAKPNTTLAELKKPGRSSNISRSFKNGPVATQDIEVAGLLPKGYKLPTSSVTNTSTTTTTAAPSVNIEDIFSKIKFDDNLEKLLPKDYKVRTTGKPPVTLVDDISKFLPPDYKLSSSTTTAKPAVVLIHDDISKFLPPGYKPPKDQTEEPIVTDISKLLPPGFKLNETNKAEDSIDIAQLLPKDYKPPKEEVDGKKTHTANSAHPASSTSTSSTSTTTEKPATTTASSGYKVVFPKGIHKRIGSQRLTTPRTHESGEGGTSPPVVIKKGPPQRATTEFTGWPTPSTTPISIEKLLEQAKTASINFEDLLGASTTTTTTTSTTTTTTTTPRPTKPGHCTTDCDLAATIKIIDGVAWKPELLDHNTVEWKNLAREVEAQLNEVYSKAPQLGQWYKKVRIDSFSKGSVLVDYYVELANITRDVNTLEIKRLFHEALTPPTHPMVPEKPATENETDSEDDMDEMYKQVKEEKLVKETFAMGSYIIDPVATDFTVIPKTISPVIEFAEEDQLLPQWAIVVIVIGVGSLLFIIIFGVTVLLSRQKRSKKTPIPLTTDMLNELKINHMGGNENYGVDDFYNIDDAWNDTKQPIKPKRFTNSVQGSSGSNIYDSWRSTRHGDYYYDSQHNYSQKGDTLQRAHHQHAQQPHQSSQSHHQHNQYPSHQSPYNHQYPDAFADAHQLYTYNNHGTRARYPRDYDPDF